MPCPKRLPVRGWAGPFELLHGLAEQRLGGGRLTGSHVQARPRLQRRSTLRMALGERLALQSDRLIEQVAGPVEVAPLAGQRAEPLQVERTVWMIGTEHGLLDRQRGLVPFARLCRAPLAVQRARQVGEHRGVDRVLRPEGRLALRPGLAEDLYGAGVAALIAKQARVVVQINHAAWVVGPEHLARELHDAFEPRGGRSEASHLVVR